MRISFVGKGGAGKSTIAASFASYLSKNTNNTVVIFDADLNMHIPKLLGFETIPYGKHLSNPQAIKTIKEWLVGENTIVNFNTFRKTTPPTRKSNILRVQEIKESPLARFGLHSDNLSIFAVGTYQEEEIGASCYHNNLSILESILSHSDDKDTYLIADMVAGVDSFAGTLHAQFDITCLVVEPTKRSIEVYEKYKTLAENAGIIDSLYVVVNKVRSALDKEFVTKYIDKEKILGYYGDDEHIRHIDQTEEVLNIGSLSDENKKLLNSIKTKVDSLPDSRNKRLTKIWELHKKYVMQDFVIERFGDLTNQIDTEFSFHE